MFSTTDQPQTQWQSLYQSVFTESQDESVLNKALAGRGDPCHSSSQTLPTIPSKTDWLAPFIVLFLLLYCCGRLIEPIRPRAANQTRQPKRRLHLTQCVFQE
ncbi:hypothetical protein [Vibrio sp. N418]|uniref:hypothetical protein n=1 Tax=Vibrio sp. (strain N418) TaxID=701176 RepID=UPI001CBC5D75|nr:hypothetical protein [Vibrio sp. N418]